MRWLDPDLNEELELWSCELWGSMLWGAGTWWPPPLATLDPGGTGAVRYACSWGSVLWELAVLVYPDRPCMHTYFF